MGEDRGVERADIGEVPVEAAARHPHGFRQRLRFERGKAAAGQRFQALIEPVPGRELIVHALTCDIPPYTHVLTGASR